MISTTSCRLGTMWITIVTLLSFLPLAFTANSDVQVTVYEGPTKCNNIDKDDKPIKVLMGYIVSFHFTITIDESSTKGTRGKKVESSHDKGIAPSFPVGQGKVIAGLDQGLLGLCKGAKAYIVIPPHLAYGDAGVPENDVPGGTTLRYDVEIIEIQLPLPNEFKKIDHNGDWKLSRDEAEQYFSKEGKQVDLDGLWAAEDIDKDGFISWEEFTGPKGGEGPPKQQRQGPSEEELRAMKKLFSKIDADQDGSISKKELSTHFEEKGKKEVDVDELVASQDGDGDGLISWDEFINPQSGEQQQADPRQVEREQMMQIFAALDTNGDAKISKEELTENFKRGGKEMDVDAIMSSDDIDGDGFISLDEFMTVREEQAQMNSMLQIFAQIDADQDGKISKEELGNALQAAGEEMTDEFWIESDTNKDGFVSIEEFIGTEEDSSSDNGKADGDSSKDEL